MSTRDHFGEGCKESGRQILRNAARLIICIQMIKPGFVDSSDLLAAIPRRSPCARGLDLDQFAENEERIEGF
jgi:hypothetical protein